ncbi:hypothetical protein D3C74_470710 [compost metagenome]
MIVRWSFTAPTVIAEGLIPGDSTVRGLGPLLPAEMTTVNPALTAFSTAWTSRSSSDELLTGPPKDMDRMRSFKRCLLAMHHSIPLIMVES